MTAQQVRARVIFVLTEQLGVDENECTSNAKLIHDLGMEENDWLDIALELDDIFDRDFDPDELEDIVTVSQLLDFVVSKVHISDQT